MKNHFLISDSEKSRILNLHESRKDYHGTSLLNEETTDQVKREIVDVLQQLKDGGKDESLWSTFSYVISAVLKEKYNIESQNLDATIDEVATILANGVSSVEPFSELGFFNGYGDFVTENKDTIMEKLKDDKEEVINLLGLDDLPSPY